MLDRVPAAAEPARQRLAPDQLDVGVRQPPAGALGLDLARDQDLVDERTRAFGRAGPRSLGSVEAAGSAGREREVVSEPVAVMITLWRGWNDRA